MSIESQLAELEHRRDAVLQEMDDNATHLGEYIKTQYSPVNVLRRHIGPAIGIAATIGTLAASAKAPRAGLMRLLWTRLLHGGNHSSKTTRASGTSDSVASPNHAASASNPSAESHQPDHRGFRDVAEPIVRNIIMDVAQAIPWSSLLDRVRDARKSRGTQSDRKEPPTH